MASALISGLIGAAAGAFIGYGGLLEIAWLSPWMPVVGGFVVGTAGASVARQRTEPRDAGFREAARRSGLQYVGDAVDAGLDDLFAGGQLPSAFKHVARARSDDAELTVGDLWFRGNDGPDWAHTVAVFRSPRLRLPRFNISPVTGVTRVFLRLVEGAPIVLGQREFDGAYRLQGSPEATVRALFRRPVLDHLLAHAELSIRGLDDRLVVYRFDKMCAPADLPAFRRQAEAVFALFARAASDVSELPVREAESPTDIAAFLAAPRPRHPPPRVHAAYVTRFPLYLALVSAVVPFFFAALAWSQPGSGPQAKGVSAAFLVAGWVVAVAAFKYRHDRLDLLRNGIVSRGTIVGVEPANLVGRYHVRIRFRAEGEREASVAVDHLTLSDAKRLAAAGETVRVLYDARDPRRVIWPDRLV